MSAVPVSQVAAQQASQQLRTQKREEDDGFDFFDFLDIINPLQHIPIVSTIYRAVTGDEIGSVAQLIGGGLYGFGLLGGGWLSLASTAANVALEEATGNDIAGHVFDFVFGEDGEALAPEGGDGAEGSAGLAPAEAPLPEDEAALAAIPRPAAVVLRSSAAPAGGTDRLIDGTPAATAEQTALVAQDAGDVAAATGQTVLSPAMSQALLLAGQSGDDGAAAGLLSRLLPRGAEHPDQLREVGPGTTGYALAGVTMQVAPGVTAGRLAAAAAY
ncbi:MAG: hypothetical protein R3F55_25080 [Alphaproteobacteria bacterium]